MIASDTNAILIKRSIALHYNNEQKFPFTVVNHAKILLKCNKYIH